MNWQQELWNIQIISERLTAPGAEGKQCLGKAEAERYWKTSVVVLVQQSQSFENAALFNRQSVSILRT